MQGYTDLLPETKSEKHGAFTWEPAIDNATSHVAGVLTLTGKRCHCRYRVEEFPSDFTGRAFILLKLDAGSDKTEERYSCFVGQRGERMCDCAGFTYGKGKPCKHLVSLAALIDARRV